MDAAAVPGRMQVPEGLARLRMNGCPRDYPITKLAACAPAPPANSLPMPNTLTGGG